MKYNKEDLFEIHGIPHNDIDFNLNGEIVSVTGEVHVNQDCICSCGKKGDSYKHDCAITSLFTPCEHCGDLYSITAWCYLRKIDNTNLPDLEVFFKEPALLS